MGGFDVGDLTTFDHLTQAGIDDACGADLKVFAIHVVVTRGHALCGHALLLEDPFSKPVRSHNHTASLGDILIRDHTFDTAEMIRMGVRINHTDNGSFPDMVV